MAIVYIDGFNYPTSTLDARYTVGGDPQIVLPGYHGGNLLIPGGAIDASNLQKTLPVSNSIITVGFAFRYTGTASNDKAIIYLRAGSTTQITLRLRPSRELGIYQSTSTIMGRSTQKLPEDEWHFIEWYVAIDPVFGESQLKVDGEEWVTVQGDTQGDRTDNFVDGFTIGEKIDGLAGTFQYDDFYMCHGVNYLGPYVEVKTIYPTADDTVNSWDATSSPHYLAVNEFAADDDDSYASTEAEGPAEFYQFQSLSTDGEIKAVQPVAHCKRTSSPHKMAIYGMPVPNDFRYVDITPNLLPTYKSYSVVSTEIPGTSTPWDLTSLNSFSWGFQLTPLNGPPPPIS